MTTGGGFPDSTYNSTNYWVDVVFAPGADSAPPVITAVTAYPLAAGTAQITWTTEQGFQLVGGLRHVAGLPLC